jgi:hypothetical protein
MTPYTVSRHPGKHAGLPRPGHSLLQCRGRRQINRDGMKFNAVEGRSGDTSLSSARSGTVAPMQVKTEMTAATARCVRSRREE